MTEAVIVSACRTAVGKAYRGALNDTSPQQLAGHVIRAALAQAFPGEEHIEKVRDVVMGCALQQGASSFNLARQAALSAGLPVSTPGTTIDRQCSSGLMALSIASQQIRDEGFGVIVAGGVESCSIVQTEHMNSYRTRDPRLVESHPALYMQMIETAEVVAERYGVSREAQDEFALISQRRTAAAQQERRFHAEIVPITVRQAVFDKATGETSYSERVFSVDECNRPSTTLEGLSALEPVLKDGQRYAKGRCITAGNSSQLSDGAAALVIMSGREAMRMNARPLGALLGVEVAGCEPDEMGIGPVMAIPRLLKRFNLTIDDIDLWEINEAFASQALYCRDHLCIPPEKLNVDGGAIAMGHPYGMSGARMAAHILHEGGRLGAKWGVVSMCIGGGMGTAGLFEIY